MMSITLNYPNSKKQELEFEVEVQGDEWRVVKIQAWVPALHDWAEYEVDKLSRRTWRDFIVEGIADAKIGASENEMMDKAKDDRLFKDEK